MEKELLKKDQILGRRIGAFVVDYLIIMLISLFLIPFVTNTNIMVEDLSEFYQLFSVVMIAALFCILLKDVFKGRSIGKMVFGLYVREYEHEEEIPKLYKLMLRNVLLPLWLIEFIVLVADKEGRRLGDKIAKTQVIGYKTK